MALAKGTTTQRQDRGKKPRRQTDQSDRKGDASELAYALKLTPKARAIRYGNEVANRINAYERESKRPRRRAPSERFEPPRPGERFTPPPGDRGGFLDAALGTPSSILGNLGRAATTVGRVGEAAGEAVFSPLAGVVDVARWGPGQARGPSKNVPFRLPQEVVAGQRMGKAATEIAVGPETANLIFEGKRPGSRGGKALLGLELASVVPVARPIRGARAAIAASWAAKGARSVRDGRRLAVAAFEETMEGRMLAPEVVSKARRWATLRNMPEREVAHNELDTLIPDVVTRRRVKGQIDAEVYRAVEGLPAAERASEAARQYEEIGQQVASAPRHPVAGFSYGRPEEQAGNLRSFIRSEGHVAQRNEPMRSRGMEDLGEGEIDPTDFQVVGKPTPEEWVRRTEHSVGGDQELGLQLAHWYQELGNMFRTFFGDDADSVIRGFAVSQANASPSGGLQAVLRVRDKLLRGEEIKKDEISTVVKSIEAAIQGEHVSAGMAKKLTDFANSLEGKKRRTWTGDDIRGGKPTAVDIHAQRDLGQIDPSILDTLRYRHGLPVGHLQLDNMENDLRILQNEKPPKKLKTDYARRKWRKKQKEKIDRKAAQIEKFRQTDQSAIEEGLASGLVMDNPQGAAGGADYDALLRDYAEITDYVNAMDGGRGLWGKNDWEPYEIQALGWSAIQRLHGVVPEGALEAIERNTYQITMDLMNGTARLGEHLDYATQAAVQRTVLDRIGPALVESENAFLREIDHTVGTTLRGGVAPTTRIVILATPEQVDRITTRAADMFDAYDVEAVRVGVTVSKRKGDIGVGRAALEIRSPSFSDREAADVFWTALRENATEKQRRHLESFVQVEVDGVPTLRVTTNRGALSPKDAPGFLRGFQSLIDRTMEQTGLDDVRYGSVNVELRTAQEAGSVPGASRAARKRGVGDQLAAEADDLLRSEFERAVRPRVARDLYGGVAPEPGVRHGAVLPEGRAQEAAMFPPGAQPGEGMRDVLYPKPTKINDPPSLSAEEREVAMNEWLRLANMDTPLSAQEWERRDALTRLLGLRHDTPPGSPISTPPGGSGNGPPRGTVGGTPDPNLNGGTPEAHQDFGAARRILRRGTQGAKATYARQKVYRGIETRRRAGALEYQLEQGTGSEAFRAGGRELQGEMPALNFKGYKELNAEGLEALYEHIRLHPNLRSFEKYRAYRAITKAIGGRVPAPAEVKLLERAFGKEVTKNIKDAVGFAQKGKHLVREVWGLPRALMSSFDLSAPFRQGLMVAVRPRYQRIFWSNMAEMHRMWGSQRVYDEFMGMILESPNYGLYQQAGVKFTDVGEDLAKREEAFMSHLAETITGGKYSYVRASNRAYTGFLNKTRADIFDFVFERARQSGVDVTDEKFLKSLGDFVNSSTGRGSGEFIDKHTVSLTALLWSPRLLWSRLNFLNPFYYARMHPYVRKEALRSAFALSSTIGFVLGVAALAGAHVETDPRNANFAKIKVGDTRVDILGGFQQPVRLLAQIASGKIISSTTGEEMVLEGGFAGQSRMDVAQRFLRSKLNPAAAGIWDLLEGETFEHKPLTVKNQIADRVAPLLLMDSFDVLREGNKGAALANLGIGLYGIGTQTYGAEGANQGPAAPSPGGGFGEGYGGGFGEGFGTGFGG